MKSCGVDPLQSHLVKMTTKQANGIQLRSAAIILILSQIDSLINSVPCIDF